MNVTATLETGRGFPYPSDIPYDAFARGAGAGSRDIALNTISKEIDMRRHLAATVTVLMLLVAATALSNSYNTPTIDGRVSTLEGDWETDERAGRDPRDDSRYYPDHGDLVDLWVTWDEMNLYFGVRTTNGPANDPGNGYVVYIDTDAQEGITGATDFTSADFYPRRLTFSTMGADAIFGVWNLDQGSHGVRHCTNPSSTVPIEGAFTQINPGFQHIECAIPWDGLYGLGAGVVPEGTVLRFVAAIVGPDNTGAYDALPTTTSGMESDPATPQGAYTDLDLFIEIPLDEDGDGVPDTNYPPGGSISGTVALGDTTDQETVVTVTAYQGGEAVWYDNTPAGGGAYEIERLADGTYDVTADAFSYLPATIEGVAVSDTSETAGIDFALTKVTGRIEGEIAISGGPDIDVTVGVYDAMTGEVKGDGEVVIEGGTGVFSIGTVVDGTWLVLAGGKGYVEADTMATIAGGDTSDVGLLSLPVVVATKYGFSDSLGNNIYGVGTTVSTPDSSIHYYAEAWLEPRDDGDRLAYWDYGAQDSVILSATKLDPSYPPSGAIVFAGPDSIPLQDSMIPQSMFTDGRAPFLVAGDAVEVLLVRASNDSIDGVLEVGIAPAAPTKLELTASVLTIPVGGDSVVQITGQLLDAARNPARLVGIPVSMSATGAGGEFSVRSPLTDSNGSFDVTFWGTTSGEAEVTAVIDPSSQYASIAVDILTILLEPGEPSLVDVSVSPVAFRVNDSGTVKAEVIDEWGNPVSEEGLQISLSAIPSDLLAVLETPIETDSLGVATAAIAAGTRYGLVELSGSAPGLPVGTFYLPIDATIVTVDETAPESDPEHNSDPGVDLTTVRGEVDNGNLLVMLGFRSNWDGVHLALLLETAGNAEGGTTDPFGFPISYGHALSPDYCFTYKYAAGDYADLRKHEDGQWKHRNFDTNEWVIGHQEGVDAVGQGLVWKTESEVTFTVPLSVVEATAGDSVRMQVYLMQETDGEKRAALDSAPQDATHDMTPDTGEWWETATDPVTLSNWSIFVPDAGGVAPLLSNGAASPAVASPDTRVVYTAMVEDAGDGVGDVFIDLSRLGGSQYTRMRDDGQESDEFAGDQIYTAARVVGGGAAGGDYELWVSARDSLNVSESQLAIELTIENPAVAIRSIVDPVGDDHGPNKVDIQGNPVDGLYYYYPTDVVFHPGAFDLTQIDVLSDGDRIVFRVFIDSLRYHGEPDAADWEAPEPSQQTCTDPNRTDLNLQKIDIYVDARETEGATSGFPNRYVDIATVDAWDYGIAVEGWGKWFVISNNQNSTAGWSLYKNDSDISLCNSHVGNFIDISVRRDLLGISADADSTDVSRAVNSWDVVVTMSSHDGESNDQNLGGIRSVNQETGQWQLGGGADGVDGREKDANIIDVATSPGEGHQEGRSQEEMLDYEDETAQERFGADLTACVLEASYSIDNSPPVVADFDDPNVTVQDPDLQHVPWTALENAPLVLWTSITDINDVRSATLNWHPVGDTTGLSTVPMVNLFGSAWAADIRKEDIEAGTNIIDVPGTGDARDIIVRVRAEDDSPNHNVIETSPKEIAIIEPWVTSQRIADIDTTFVEGEDYAAIFQDGTLLVLEPGQNVPESGLNVVLEPVGEGSVDLGNIRDDMTFAGVARDIRLESGDLETVPLSVPAWLILHYPQYGVGRLNESAFGIFAWNELTERWIAKGGAANESGNTIATVGLEELGLFGIFEWDALDVGDERGLSGVLAEPNPFSPNGDGLYDDTVITFYLGRPADYVNIEFYDLAGVLARRLVFQQATNYTGRTFLQMTWDGTDMNGNVVPYGLYVMRLEAKFKTEPTFERVNRPVAVIR